MLDAAPWSRVQLLLQRLERISADSRWAHLASGYRGSLMKLLEAAEAGQPLDAKRTERLEQLLQGGGEILLKAARERISRRKI